VDIVRALGQSEREVPASMIACIFVRAAWDRNEGALAVGDPDVGLDLPELLGALVRLANYVYHRKPALSLAKRVSRLLKRRLHAAVESTTSDAVREALDGREGTDLFFGFRGELGLIFDHYADMGAEGYRELRRRRDKERRRRQLGLRPLTEAEMDAELEEEAAEAAAAAAAAAAAEAAEAAGANEEEKSRLQAEARGGGARGVGSALSICSSIRP